MRVEDEPTQRIYRTAVGTVDWARATDSAQAICAGHIATGNYRCLEALFDTALAHDRVLTTSSGDWTTAATARLLDRLRKRLTVADIDALWGLLFKLFDR